MADSEIEAFLQKAMGLKVDSIGKGTLDRSVQKRMKALAINESETYVEKIKSSALELKNLIEEVVIPETYFFRDREPFLAIIQYLVSHWIPKKNNSILKVLSAPCSTGEEPYSIAMCLLNSGFPAEKFTVHAVDISSRFIATAKKGIYTNNSFRGSDLAFRSQYFKKSPKYYTLNKNIRDKIHFHTGNILNKSFMEGLGLFDVIFFRNVLIYFDAHSRQQSIDTLHEILAEDGIIFVGHAEANLFSDSPFTPAPFKQAFAFHKKINQQLIPETSDMAHAEPIRAKRKTTRAKRLSITQKKVLNQKPDLAFARKLADQGQLEKARTICEDYLAQCGPSFQAFFLLGIIYETTSDVKLAEKHYRKALYLDPNHNEVLFFLSLLVEKTGNKKEATFLKKRLERLQDETSVQQQNNQIHGEGS
jgi:chemotaxis protein methyltransferase WspC